MFTYGTLCHASIYLKSPAIDVKSHAIRFRTANHHDSALQIILAPMWQQQYNHYYKFKTMWRSADMISFNGQTRTTRNVLYWRFKILWNFRRLQWVNCYSRIWGFILARKDWAAKIILVSLRQYQCHHHHQKLKTPRCSALFKSACVWGQHFSADKQYAFKTITRNVYIYTITSDLMTL